MHDPIPEPAATRLVLPDLARALALVGMAAYHLTYDLELFGFVAPGTASSPFWSGLARLVAVSFVALAGASLWLAHGRAIRWRGFWRRAALVGAGAAAVSLATCIVMPDYFVYYGILHSIAVSSLLGLAFLRAPWPAVALAAIVVALAPAALRSEAFNHPALWWIGLSTLWGASMDFEPLLPWFAPFLAGMLAARGAEAVGWTARAARYHRMSLRGPRAALLWAGRHSLAIYLLHQPLLYGLCWAAWWLMRTA